MKFAGHIHTVLERLVDHDELTDHGHTMNELTDHGHTMDELIDHGHTTDTEFL